MPLIYKITLYTIVSYIFVRIRQVSDYRGLRCKGILLYWRFDFGQICSSLSVLSVTWWRLFQRRVVRAEFDIYVFIKLDMNDDKFIIIEYLVVSTAKGEFSPVTSEKLPFTCKKERFCQ
jgi:transcription antitermination factor NusG